MLFLLGQKSLNSQVLCVGPKNYTLPTNLNLSTRNLLYIRTCKPIVHGKHDLSTINAILTQKLDPAIIRHFSDILGTQVPHVCNFRSMQACIIMLWNVKFVLLVNSEYEMLVYAANGAG